MAEWDIPRREFSDKLSSPGSPRPEARKSEVGSYRCQTPNGPIRDLSSTARLQASGSLSGSVRGGQTVGKEHSCLPAYR